MNVGTRKSNSRWGGVGRGGGGGGEGRGVVGVWVGCSVEHHYFLETEKLY